MSKLNVQMTFAVIFTLAFIFYPVIGYSYPHEWGGYYGEPHGYNAYQPNAAPHEWGGYYGEPHGYNKFQPQFAPNRDRGPYRDRDFGPDDRGPVIKPWREPGRPRPRPPTT